MKDEHQLSICSGTALVMSWQPVTQGFPRPGVPVLVVLQTPRPCVILAQWCPAHTLSAHHDADNVDYDEEHDAYFAPEGWYQCYTVNGELDDEPYWKLDDRVSHWMSLPLPPGATVTLDDS